MDNLTLLQGILILALGSYGLRIAGPYMRQHLMSFSKLEKIASELSGILLFSVAITAALFEASHFAGFSRLLGFLVAAFLTYKKMPFIIIVLSAAITTAILRALGMS
jgi:hypothetical protein